MTAKVERAAGPLRTFVREIADQLRVGEREYRLLYAPRVSRLGFRVDARDVRERAAWAAVAQWLVGYGAGAIDARASLGEAEDWFLNGKPALPRVAPNVGMPDLAALLSPAEAFALLPYLLDPLAPGTRRCVLRSGDFLGDRLARKAAGAYYTPADLAQYMAEAARALQADTCLDPACGSGVFLRAAHAAARNRRGPRLFGCDIDPLAVEQCSFVLLALALDGPERCSPWALWQLGRLNLATVDSLLLVPGSPLSEIERRMRGREVEDVRVALRAGDLPTPAENQQAFGALGALFPDLVEGAEVLLCNPPYARLGDHDQSAEIARLYASFAAQAPAASSDTSTPFVEHAWRLTRAEGGRAAVVVPLSVAFNSTAQFRGLRQGMALQPGRWRCAFFDRAPDALFGDDVKTRNAVLVYDAAKPAGIETTSILRWTSRNRRQFLASVRCTPLDDAEITELIPKLGSDAEARLYHAVRALPEQLRTSLMSIDAVSAVEAANDDHRRAVYVAPTAYNWLNCARTLGAWREGDDFSSSPFTRLRLAAAPVADAAYAILSSRLVFWLWRVEGDAFHVPRRYLQALPFGLEAVDDAALARLARLGSTLWQLVAERPAISVNKGKRTLAFPAPGHPELIDLIDERVISAFGLDRPAQDFDLRTWYEKTVVVDESEARRLSLLAARRGRVGA